MALTDAFENTKMKLAATGLAITMAFAAAIGSAQAQDLAANTTDLKVTPVSTGTTTAVTPRGKDVILRVGRDFSPSSAKSLARVLNESGCPTVVTEDGLFDNGIEIEVGEDFAEFENPGSAGNYALKRCLEQS